MSKRTTLLSVALALAGVSSLGAAQNWALETYRVVEGESEIAPEPSANLAIGPFELDFFCHAFGGASENLMLAITPAPSLGGLWQQTYLAGGFDGVAQVTAGEQSVGTVPSFADTATGKVMMTFRPGRYDLATLISGQDLTFRFEGANVPEPYRFAVRGDELGPALCSVVPACGVNTAATCGIFTAVTGVRTFATPLSDTLDQAGNPRWFKSDFQKPEAAFPYYRTASIVDPESNSEFHLSCLAREGQALAVHHLRGATQQSPAMFDVSNFDDSGQEADLVWQAGEEAGRFANVRPLPEGEGLWREGIAPSLGTRAMLETLMTTNDPIQVTSRFGDQSLTSTFSAAGSRDAICAVMRGCSVPLGFSPACTARN